MADRWERKRQRWGHRGPGWGRGPGGYASSGNRAFDEYREATLQRLEEEVREFREFLDRLKMARDKSEFDQFMAERRNRDATGSAGEQPPTT